MNDIYTGLIPLKLNSNKFIGPVDAKWKIKENEWYLYGFDTVKIKF
jgi:hypothetical protein